MLLSFIKVWYAVPPQTPFPPTSPIYVNHALEEQHIGNKKCCPHVIS